MSIKKTTMVSTACLIVCASAATAQTSVDKSFTAVSKDCSGIQWSQRALTMYPTIGSACQSVEERNGKTFVKFQGTLKKNVNRGEQLVVNFKDGGDVTLTPPPETSFYVDGKKTKVADLQRGSELNFYIAEDRLAAPGPGDGSYDRATGRRTARRERAARAHGFAALDCRPAAAAGAWRDADARVRWVTVTVSPSSLLSFLPLMRPRLLRLPAFCWQALFFVGSSHAAHER